MVTIQKIKSKLYKNTILYFLYKTKPSLYVKKYDKYLRKLGIDIGNSSWIDLTAWFDYLYSLIHIGNGAVISRDVIFLTHDYSICNGIYALNKKTKYPYEIRKGITIGENVFIGIRSVICPGTKIGDNSIIGAGSVVHGEIEPYSIVAGNPAKKIGDVREWANNKINTTKELQDCII